jgi:hypothetical protein
MIKTAMFCSIVAPGAIYKQKAITAKNVKKIPKTILD